MFRTRLVERPNSVFCRSEFVSTKGSRNEQSVLGWLACVYRLRAIPSSHEKTGSRRKTHPKEVPAMKSACSNKFLTVLERTVRLAPFRARPSHPFWMVFMNDGNRSRLRVGGLDLAQGLRTLSNRKPERKTASPLRTLLPARADSKQSAHGRGGPLAAV